MTAAFIHPFHAAAALLHVVMLIAASSVFTNHALPVLVVPAHAFVPKHNVLLPSATIRSGLCMAPPVAKGDDAVYVSSDDDDVADEAFLPRVPSNVASSSVEATPESDYEADDDNDADARTSSSTSSRHKMQNTAPNKLGLGKMFGNVTTAAVMAVEEEEEGRAEATAETELVASWEEAG
eukprot:CAMPEP_0178645522 /NCGR_PEP_ID=MMETSP0698-20121128/18872_1 /TAXON_ID=265572 /ORGANISM="Extubocellulus spinifer, Strain CCMP396" /LENGTH=179 /DNA_ID=CAMNT_0020286589 /DNA_START=162 /DNA_END=698 /DNA_ORIENTATION=+